MNARAGYSLVLLVVLVSGLLAHSSTVINGEPGRALAQPFGPSVHRTYWLTGGPSFSNWNGSTPGPLLTGSDGDNVTVRLRSADVIIHSWFLDLNDNNQVDPNEVATTSPDFSSTTIWLNFSFIAALGTVFPHGGDFTYRCSHHPGLMYGTFRFNAGPVASFSHSPSTPLVGHLVSFDASASWPSTGATIAAYNWNFGDGNTNSISGKTISHIYSTNKTYTVILNVTDSASQSALTSQNVTVLNPPPVPFNYGIQVTPSNATIVQGKTGNATVNLSLLTSGASENVTLTSTISPYDPTIRVSFNGSASTSGFPSYSASMKITTSPSSPNRTYTLTVAALSSTGVAHNATFTFTLKPVPFDYKMSLAPNTASIVQGQGTSSTASLTLLSGTSENVSLSSLISPLDPTIRISFSPISGFPSFSATLSISTASSTKNGNYTIMIVGMSSTGVARNATFTLILKQGPNYLPLAAYGTIAAVSLLVGFVALKRFRKKQA